MGTAFSSFLGRQWVGTVVADCQPTTPTGGILRVKIGEFPALQSENGSVRLALNPFTSNSPSGFFYPVLVNRGSGNQFFALRAACTHQGCVVPTFGGACPCHGSEYAIDGSVIAGPASTSLTRYAVTFDGADSLCIEIPSLRYVLNATAVQSGVGPRVRLQFQTRSNAKYEVLFRTAISDSGAVVPFATTEGGTASVTELNGNGAQGTLYVDRTSAAGFYSVAIKVLEA
ncbi:MAG TPA: Rieske (2Fe-2S) protein [Verrucomicrobiae bacterium]|nr:Rieske (2Fe-2S) protein [Verrucomicrobiae bacterium]